VNRSRSHESLQDLAARVKSMSPPYPAELTARLAADGRAGARRLLAAVDRRNEAYRAELERLDEMLAYERRAMADGASVVAGVDEAGRGPLAGPVVAAAVVLPRHPAEVAGLNDSKLLSAKQRDRLFNVILSSGSDVGWGIVSHRTIDQIGIQRANFMAMSIAVKGLNRTPDCLLVDGYPISGQPVRCVALVKGDRKSLSVAAASVVAKVTRDAIMAALGRRYPQYGFGRHKGYATRAHYDAVERHGLCPVHRRSFFENEKQQLLPLEDASFERAGTAAR